MPPLTRPTRHAGTLQHYTTPAVAQALVALEADLGGRQAFIAAAAAADASDDLAYVLGILADPRHDARSIVDLCQMGGLTVGELLEVFKRGQYAGMFARITATIARETPAVVHDILRRAQPHTIPCEVCHGTGATTSVAKPDEAPAPCEACRATGVTAVLPDLDRQKLAVDLAGLLPKKGPSVVVDNRRVTVPTTGDFAALQAATDRLLHPAGLAAAPRDEDASDGDVLDTGDAPA